MSAVSKPSLALLKLVERDGKDILPSIQKMLADLRKISKRHTLPDRTMLGEVSVSRKKGLLFSDTVDLYREEMKHYLEGILPCDCEVNILFGRLVLRAIVILRPQSSLKTEW